MGPTIAKPGSSRGLRERLSFIGRRRGVITLCVALLVAAVTAVSYLQTPTYEATAEVLLEPRGAELLLQQEGVPRPDPERATRTAIRVTTSERVKAKVRELLGDAPPVVAAPAGNTDVIQIRARDSDPAQAADTANAYASSFIEVRKAEAIDEILASVERIQAKLSELQRQIDQTPPPGRDALVRQQEAFKNRLDLLQVEAEVQTGDAEVVTPAQPPEDKVAPRPLRNALLALLAGLVLGLIVAAVAEALDDSIKTKEDLERLVPDLPVLGMIPPVLTWRDNQEAVVVSLTEPHSPAAESYRTLRTAIQFLSPEAPLRTLQVVSAAAGEGKSTTAANLAVACAAAGQRVVLVCADLRRPRLHDFFGLSAQIGFTSVILGKAPLSEALQEVPNQPRLYVLASGPLPPNPSELLSSRRTVDGVTSLQADVDLVIVDSAPILPVTDGLVLSGRVDGTLLVAAAASTTRKEVGRAVELLAQVDARVVGIVLNGVTAADLYGDGYQPYPAHVTGGRRREAARGRTL